jgi:hypothetical protein
VQHVLWHAHILLCAIAVDKLCRMVTADA